MKVQLDLFERDTLSRGPRMPIPEHYAPSAEDRAQLRAEGYPLNSIAPEVVRRKLQAHLNKLRKGEVVHSQDLLDLIEGLLYLLS